MTLDDARRLFAELPSDLLEVVTEGDCRQEGEDILVYPALLHLFHFVVRSTDLDNASVRKVLDLVTALYENGDGDCRDLVNLQFFELLADQPEDVKDRVLSRFSKSMRKSAEYKMSPARLSRT